MERYQLQERQLSKGEVVEGEVVEGEVEEILTPDEKDKAEAVKRSIAQ